MKCQETLVVTFTKEKHIHYKDSLLDKDRIKTNRNKTFFVFEDVNIIL
jgi:hypothetical protein